MKLKSPDDVTRLFSALAEVPLLHESSGYGGLTSIPVQASGAASSIDNSLTEYELSALANPGGFDDPMSVLLTGAVGIIASWVAIRGYERNQDNLGWGMTWGLLGVLFPLPSAAYTALQS